MLVRLLYASQSTSPLDQDSIAQILDATRRNNLADGVTGMLCHGNNRFLQCLEGEKEPVDQVYARISHDPRHHHLKQIDYKDLERRVFGDWSMGFIDLNDMRTKILLRQMTKTEEFLPETMDANDAFTLIKNFKSMLSNQVIVN